MPGKLRVLVFSVFLLGLIVLAPAVSLFAAHPSDSDAYAASKPAVLSLGALGVYAAEDRYMITNSYDVSVVVHENNVFDVTERISVEFLERSRGIYRYIPYRGDAVSQVDGEIVTQDARMKISNISTGSDENSVTTENGELSIRIGNPDIYLMGEHDYVISYTLQLFDDRIDAYDSIYLNVIPRGWTTSINKATVSITFPKDTDVSGAEFIGMESGVTSTEVMNVTAQWPDSSGNYILTAVSKNGIAYGEGLTFRVVLPEGYFVGEQKYYTSEILFWIFLCVAPIGCILLWFLFGRDRRVVETVEFRAPEGMTPAEIGLFWDGKLHDRDMFAMFLYWADKGKLSIEERDKDDFRLHKLGVLDADSKPFEFEMSSKIFSGSSIVVSIKKDASKISKAIDAAKQSLIKSFSDDTVKTLYDKRSLIARGFGFLLSFLPSIFLLVYAVDTGGMAASGVASAISDFIGFAIMPFFFFFIFAVRIGGGLLLRALSGSASRRSLAHDTLLSPWLIVGIVLLFVVGLLFLSSPLLALAAVGSTVVSIVFSVWTRKKTEYYTNMLGRIRGFANFIKTAELDRIKMLVDENPEYFYDILPYAWAMDLTDVWAKKFDQLGITLQPPDWYGGYRSGVAFSYGYMVGSMSRFTRSFESSRAAAAASAARSSSGGGSSGGGGGFSSGGGSSGGGFGGGGGGRW